jgi:hypothetical protein
MCCWGDCMYGACCIGARVTGGPGASWTVDSGYMPLGGTMCRRDGSVVGCSSSGAPE